MKEKIKQLRTELATLTNQTKTLYAELEAKGADKVTADERTKLDNMIDDGMKKREEMNRLIALADNDEFVNQPADAPKAGGKRGGGAARPKSWGQIVVASDQYKKNDGLTMKPVQVKDLYSGGDGTAGGLLIQPMRETEVVNLAPQRERTLLDLLNIVRTTSNSIEYYALVSRTNSAAVVSERTATDGSAGNDVYGLKPASNLVFAQKTAVIKTIATYVKESRELLQDAPRLADTIDGELTDMLEIVLENEVLNGDGSGNHFTGILATPDIGTRTQGTGARSDANDTKADTLRRAIGDVRMEFYRADGIALSPADSEALELEKDQEGRYMNVYDPVQLRIWRVPIVEVDALEEGTAVVADWKRAATLYDRMQTEIRISENVDDDFIRNAIRILAELRAGLAVKRPKAVVQVTFS